MDSPDDLTSSESAGFHFKGFTYVAPCVLEDLHRPEPLPRLGYVNLPCVASRIGFVIPVSDRLGWPLAVVCGV